jgi:hypothetical protein
MIRTFLLPISHGWRLAIDEPDMKRWNPDEVMPPIHSAMSHAETFVKPKGVPSMSDDLVIDAKPVRCVAILTRYPANPFGLCGTVWIGTKREAKAFRRQSARQNPNMGRFKAVVSKPDAN